MIVEIGCPTPKRFYSPSTQNEFCIFFLLSVITFFHLTLSLLSVSKTKIWEKLINPYLKWTPPSLTSVTTWGGQDIDNSLSELRAELRPRTRRGPTSNLQKSFFLQNSCSCPQAYQGGGCRRKSPLDGAVDFL